MKSTYLVIFVLLLIVVGVVLFNMQTKEAVAPTQEEVSAQTTANQMPMGTDQGMTMEEHEAMMGESPMGTDVGMEMPETDMTGMMDTVGVSPNPSTKMFDISGKNFSFDVTEIRVKEGDTVMIHFTSADSFHDLVIDEFNAKTEKVRSGGMSVVTFVANKKGTFEYYCSVGSHRASGMVGKLIVE